MRLRFIVIGLLALACAKGARTPVCLTGETNRCSCPGGGEGLQACVPGGASFGECSCSAAWAGGAACALVPSLVGKDMDEAGAAVAAAGLELPDPVDPKGFITVPQISDPPVQVLGQDPPAGTAVKAGTRLTLAVTRPAHPGAPGGPHPEFPPGRLAPDTPAGAQAVYRPPAPRPLPTR